MNACDMLEEILLKCLPDENQWRGKRYSIVLDLPLTNRGDVAELFLKWLLEEKNGADAELHSSRRGPWDVKTLSDPPITLEAKCATLDVGGSFQFNGIRYDRCYDLLFALGIAPESVHVGLWRRSELLDLNMVAMAKGTNSSFKLSRRPADLYDPDEWLPLWNKVAVEKENSDKYAARKEKPLNTPSP